MGDDESLDDASASASASASADAGVDPPRRRNWRLYARIAAVLSLAAVLAPVVVRLTGWEAGPLAYVVSLLPWVVVAFFVPLSLALLGRSKTLAIAAVVPLAVGVYTIQPLFWSWNVVTGDDIELRVATVNATFGQADADAIVAMVRDHEIDVLAVQELTPGEVRRLESAGLDDALPYSEVHAEEGFTGTGLWSRLPMGATRDVPGLSARTVTGTVEVGFISLVVYAVHPAAPGPFDHSLWEADMVALAKLSPPSEGPVLIMGDFNATRDHSAFRHLESLGYDDAADQAGAGFMPTFPQGRLPFPLVAIDHMVIRGSLLSAVSVSTVVIPGADHRALVATYAWQG